MKKIVVKDYEYIGKEMDRLSRISEYPNGDDNLAYQINGYSADNVYAMSYDMKVLSGQLLRYFELTCKNFEFESFYDKKFMDVFKSLIKNPDEFERFLDMVHLDVKDFLHIAVHISPNCFTSNLVKYIKENYLK